MVIDLRTLSIATGLIYSLMAIALILQFSLNKNYRGVGWWAIGYTFMAAGFIFLIFRDIASIELFSIFSANTMLVAGVIFLYTGTLKFIGRTKSGVIPVLFFTVFLISTFYVIFIKRDNNLRVIIIYTASAIIACLTAYHLFFTRIRSIRISAVFTSAVFFLFGSFFLFRVLTIISSGYIEPVFSPGVLQISTFFISLISGILWTSGFIIMVNQRLTAENREDREKFELFFDSIPDATLIIRIDNRRIVAMNEGFTVITGFSYDEAIGKTSIELNLWTEPGDHQKLVNELTSKGTCDNFEAVFRIKSGKIVHGIVSARIIKLNGMLHILSITRDITARKQAEEKIRNLLNEKELILKEVHHRIKNNMNNIKGLLYLQAETLEDPSAAAALNDAESRVASMMVLYEKLYRSDDFSQLPISEYLPRLVEEIISNFPNKEMIRIEKYIHDFAVDSETLFAVGIIVNEIITNIMKYAFTGRTDGVITLCASSIDDKATLVVGDNGNGMPDDIDFQNSSSFGLQLINTMVKQIRGTIRIEHGEGTRFIIDF